jgi:hypothetical protein
MKRPRPIASVSRGYFLSPSPERAASAVLTSYSITIAAARGVNYVRERRRVAPRLRSLARRAYAAPRGDGARVHHFLPGIALSLLTGGVAVVTRTTGAELRFGLPFGTGAALTLDELALLTGFDKGYWRSERFAIVQGGVSAFAAAILAGRFGWRGRAGAGPAEGDTFIPSSTPTPRERSAHG